CSRLSLDHLIRSRQHVRWNRQADLLRSLQIEHKLELHRLLDRKVGWLGPFEDLIDISGSAPIQVGSVRSICHQTAKFDEFLQMKDRRQTALCGKLRDPFLICNKQRACQYGKRASARLGRLLEGLVEIIGVPYSDGLKL